MVFRSYLYYLMSNPFHHSSTARAETGITGIKDNLWLVSNPFHHSSTTEAETGIKGIKDKFLIFMVRVQSLPPQFNCRSRNRNNRDQRLIPNIYGRCPIPSTTVQLPKQKPE